MALHKKLSFLLRFQPDVAVIPEMASPNRFDAAFRHDCDFNMEWAGHIDSKGLGVLINRDWRYRIADCYRPDFELFLPIEIEAPVRINLLAVWAFNHRAKAISSKENRTVNVIKYYSDWIASAPTVMMGDFNHSVVWDKPSKPSNFVNIVSQLSELDLISLVHDHFNWEFGMENAPTLYLSRDRAKPYHVDYIFVPKSWVQSERVRIEVGQAEEWLGQSDHMPLISEMNI